MRYAIPFYSYYGRLCFLNPGDQVVVLGLCKGAFLADSQRLLEGVGKEVGHVRISSWEDIDLDALQILLQEAMLWNEVTSKHRSKR